MSQPKEETLTAEGFRRLREVFEAALDRPREQRRAYLEKECRGDAALLAEVERMLAAESESDKLLDRVEAPGARRPSLRRFLRPFLPWVAPPKPTASARARYSPAAFAS